MMILTSFVHIRIDLTSQPSAHVCNRLNPLYMSNLSAPELPY